MAENLKLYLLAALIFTAIDYVWLRYVARSIYQKYLKQLLSPRPVLLAAVAFYLLFLLGLLVFVIVPAEQHHTAVWAAGYGALFGFFTYLTYDLTNLATLKGWPVLLSIVDIAWGSMLCAAVAGLTVWII
jgi:uncharacterized membrane protein